MLHLNLKLEDRQWLSGDGQIKSAMAERVIRQCSTLKGGSLCKIRAENVCMEKN